MDRNKKIFLVVGIIFFLIMILIGIDISKRTTFPGSKPNVEERVLQEDSVQLPVQ